MVLLLLSCSAAPDFGSQAYLADLLEKLDRKHRLSDGDIDRVDAWMSAYHQQTSLHCDTIYRRSSADGMWFDGPAQRVWDSASVADVAITDAGHHVVVFNDTRPGRLVEILRTDPERLWRQGLLGFGGLGLIADTGNGFEEQPLDLGLDHIQEAVDPDLGQRPDGTWRMVWFGVRPSEMSAHGHGPLMAPKPHRFYRAEGPQWNQFVNPSAAIESTAGSTGGADPTVLDLADGGELMMVGPLDHTVMFWRSPDGRSWPGRGAAPMDTGVPGATPDAVSDPHGPDRLYSMRNGQPGKFEVSLSSDGLNWDGKNHKVMVDNEAFNISVAKDNSGVWWAYFNRTDRDCLGDQRTPRQGPNGPGHPGENF